MPALAGQSLHTNDGLTGCRLLARDTIDAAQMVEFLAITPLDIIQREIGGPVRKAIGPTSLDFVKIAESCPVEIHAKMSQELSRINWELTDIFRLFFWDLMTIKYANVAH